MCFGLFEISQLCRDHIDSLDVLIIESVPVPEEVSNSRKVVYDIKLKIDRKKDLILYY